MLSGSIPDRVPVTMNGLAMQADLVHGQKTGVFLDQRENYLAAALCPRTRARLFHGNRRLRAAPGGEMRIRRRGRQFHSDARPGAGERAANTIANVTFTRPTSSNIFPSLVAGAQEYDMVVVDPPAFTKSRGAVEGAIRGYKEINLRALRLLGPGGILVSCSCSHHMSEARLLEVIAAAALDGGKQLRVLERRTQSHDHPILLTVPETHYLKCLIFQV